MGHPKLPFQATDTVLDEIFKVDEVSKHDCRGAVFKCVINFFLNIKGDYVHKTTMRLMKRKSCPGCEKCGPILDDMYEFISNGEEIEIVEPKDGEFYTLQYCDMKRDRETGIIDDYRIRFVKIQDK